MAGPTLIAHRGFAGTFPENTVGAVRMAGDHPGTEMVEVDVQPAADGTPVVFHDPRLGTAPDGGPGLTDREGVVWETPPATVTGAEVLGSGFTVPTLAEVRAACPDGVALNVELKNPGSFEVRPGAALDAADLAAQRDLWRPFVERVLDVLGDADVLLSSFCEAALAVAREAGDHPTAVICGGTVDAAVEIARRQDCAALHPSLDDLLDDDPRPPRARPGGRNAGVEAPARPTSRDRVLDAAAAQGWTVNAWTVTRWHEAARCHRMGVDGVIADHPTVTLAVG
jgi:glycerophosphoryl diester phosphodiesterase